MIKWTGIFVWYMINNWTLFGEFIQKCRMTNFDNSQTATPWHLVDWLTSCYLSNWFDGTNDYSPWQLLLLHTFTMKSRTKLYQINQRLYFCEDHEATNQTGWNQFAKQHEFDRLVRWYFTIPSNLCFFQVRFKITMSMFTSVKSLLTLLWNDFLTKKM